MVLEGKNDPINGRDAPLKYYLYTDFFITPYLFKLKDPAPLDLDSIFHTDLFNILLDPGGYYRLFPRREKTGFCLSQLISYTGQTFLNRAILSSHCPMRTIFSFKGIYPYLVISIGLNK